MRPNALYYQGAIMFKKLILALVALSAITGLATFGRKIVLARFES